MYFIPLNLPPEQVFLKLETFGNLLFLQKIDEGNNRGSGFQQQPITSSSKKKAFYKALFSFREAAVQESFVGIKRMRVSGVHVKIGLLQVENFGLVGSPHPPEPASLIIDGSSYGRGIHRALNQVPSFEEIHFLRPTQIGFHQKTATEIQQPAPESFLGNYCFRILVKANSNPMRNKTHA